MLAALPAIPLRDIPATGVICPCSIPRFARQRHGTHVLLQGRQIAFERPCRHPRTSRRELSGEVRNCHLKPSNRSSDSLNDLLNSSSESIASLLETMNPIARTWLSLIFRLVFSSPIRRSMACSSGTGLSSPARHRRRTEGLRPSKPPHEGALRPFRNPQVSDLSFVICHIIFRT